MPAPFFATNQVTVTSAATVIVGQNNSRHAVLVVNLGTTAVYIGANTNVTTTNGMIIPGVLGAALSIPAGQAIYGITASTNQTVAYLDL